MKTIATIVKFGSLVTLSLVVCLALFLTYQTTSAQDSVPYLGEGEGTYTLPAGYDVLIVKKFYPFRATVVTTGSYTSTFKGVLHGGKRHYERVWACRGAFCHFPTTLFMSQLELSVGTSASTFILDDDTLAMGDTRRPQMLNSAGDVVDTIESEGLSYWYSFTSTVSDTYTLDSDDSIIVFKWDISAPAPETPTATATNTETATPTDTPPVAVITSTVTTVTPTPTPTNTSVPSETPTTTSTATQTTTSTPTATQTPVEIVEAPKSFYHVLSVECDGNGTVSIEGRGEALVNVYVDTISQYSQKVEVPTAINVTGLSQGTIVEVVVDDSQGTSYVRSTVVDLEPLNCAYPDVALRKKLHHRQRDVVKRGDPVTFVIEVINQGNITLTDVSVVDYVPIELKLVEDDLWTMDGSNAIAQLGQLGVGESTELPITFIVQETAAIRAKIRNYAEVSVAEADIDSEGDAANGNGSGESSNLVDDEVNNHGGDEDDHDVAEITVSTSKDLPETGEPSKRHVFLPSVKR